MADVTNYTTMDLANMILQEKTNKITPENIRHDVQIFDIVGNYKGDSGGYAPRRIQFTGVGLNGTNYSYGQGFFYTGKNLDIFDAEHLDTHLATNLYYSFYGTPNINTLRGLTNWNTSNMTSFSHAFYGLGSIPNVNELANWDTSKVTSLYNCFTGCTNLRDISGLSNWNISNVRDMNNMFMYCNNLVDLSPLSNWTFNGVNIQYFTSGDNTDISTLKNCYFKDCTISYLTGGNFSKNHNAYLANNFTITGENLRLNFIFGSNNAQYAGDAYYWNGNCTGFYNVNGVYADFMFCRWGSLKTVNNIHFTNCNGTQGMFMFCRGLTDASNLNIHFATKGSTYIYLMGMFYNCTSLTDLTGMDNWTFTDSSSYTKYIGLGNMFYNCNKLTDESLYAITNFFILIAPNVAPDNQYIFYGGYSHNLAPNCVNGPFYGSNIVLNQRLNNYQLNRLYRAGYRGFGVY